jgi:hypothetical protein
MERRFEEMKLPWRIGLLFLIGMVSAGWLEAQVRRGGIEELERRSPKPGSSAVGAAMIVDVIDPQEETQAPVLSEPPPGTVSPVPASPEMRLPSEDDFQRAVRVVAQFLELSPDQVEAFLHLLRMRQEVVTPLLQGIAERERQLQELLGSDNPDPQVVGQLVIEIHQLRQLLGQAQAHFLAQFENLLNQEQERRWQQAQLAERLQPILPAFRLLRLLEMGILQEAQAGGTGVSRLEFFVGRHESLTFLWNDTTILRDTRQTSSPACCGGGAP